MTEESTTIVIYEDNFPAIRNETVETTVATAILHGFGDSAKTIQLDENLAVIEENNEEKIKQEPKKVKYKHKCLFFESCSKTFESLESAVSHMVTDHRVEEDHILLQEFSSFADFQLWKDNLELDNYVYYTRRNKQEKRFVYYCYKDGQPIPGVHGDQNQETKTMLRKKKISKKHGLNCPSKMIARLLDNGSVELIFYKMHSHAVVFEDTQNHPVPQLLKQELYAQFALNGTVEEVYDMLHGHETSVVYPVYRAAVRDLNRRRLRNIAKNFHADTAKCKDKWDKIRPSAQNARTDGPIASEENKKSKLVSVQHKLEQLYHLLEESVTQSLLLNYMDTSLAKLLTECSAAFAVSDVKFPLENECILKYEKQVSTESEELVDKEQTYYSEGLEENSKELINQNENKGVKRKMDYDLLNQAVKRSNNMGNQENNQPLKFNPITGYPIGVKIKQNRRKLFKVPKRPTMPGPPIRTLDVIFRPDEIGSCDKSKKTVSENRSSTDESDNNGACSSNVVNEAEEGLEESESVPEENLVASSKVTGDVFANETDTVTAIEVLQQLQLNANQIVQEQSVHMESSSSSINETSVSPQLLEIVNLAKAMVDDECSSE